MRFPVLLAAALAFTALPLHAQVTVSDPWVRASAPGSKITGAYMRITSAKDAKLVGVRSSVAGTAEVHETSVENGVMSMRAMPVIALPAGRAVELKPGSFHVMLMGLKAPVKEGETVPVTLVVEGADRKRMDVEVAAVVRPIGARSAR